MLACLCSQNVCSCLCARILVKMCAECRTETFLSCSRSIICILETKVDVRNNVFRISKLGNIGETCTLYESFCWDWSNHDKILTCCLQKVNKRKIYRVLVARHLYFLRCLLLVRQITASARKNKCTAPSHARKDHWIPLSCMEH